MGSTRGERGAKTNGNARFGGLGVRVLLKGSIRVPSKGSIRVPEGLGSLRFGVLGFRDLFRFLKRPP